jgi:antimicrobial peptide system SdpB family protein
LASIRPTTRILVPSLAIGRTLIAVAELSVLLFTDSRMLIADGTTALSGTRCSGLAAGSLGCLVGGAHGPTELYKVLAIAILVVTASGFRPRWTCIPHWYVTASIAVYIDSRNGGDIVAEIVTMLLIPICLSDRRVWQWRSPAEPLSPRWRGCVSAALLTLRVQAAAIYAISAISKIMDWEWRTGLVIQLLVENTSYGPAPSILPILQPIADIPWAARASAWGVILIEMAIAIAICSGDRARYFAFGLGVALHLGIVVVLTLPTFGAVMIGLLLIVCDPIRQKAGDRSTASPLGSA